MVLCVGVCVFARRMRRDDVRTDIRCLRGVFLANLGPGCNVRVLILDDIRDVVGIERPGNTLDAGYAR